MSDNDNRSPSGTGQTPPSKPAKAYSCVRCFERKVKCDRETPCSNCHKSGAECIFRVPPPPRRRKKRTQEEILKARLTHYEDILKARGIDINRDAIRAEDLPDPGNEDAQLQSIFPSPHADDERPTRTEQQWTSAGPFVKAKLIIDQNNRTRFVDNTLWTSMAEEFPRPGDAMPDSSDNDDDSNPDDSIDFVLGATPSSTGVRDLHPLPEQIWSLWQIFLDNVNPLSKIIHVPTLEPIIIEASSHLEKLPKGIEALMFSIYSLAVMSLPEDECEMMTGETKAVLLSRYRRGTKQALSRAKFLGTSDMTILQAFVLHLLSSREVYDSRTMWTLTGVATRLGEIMGIHRDGTSLGLPPFETQMRRRLWWQIVFLDFRTAELSGSQQRGSLGSWDVQLPLNCDDADIWPGMQNPPVEREQGSEMVFCSTRYEIGQFWKAKMLTKAPGGNMKTIMHMFKTLNTLEAKDKAIEELERLLEQKYVKFCDPSEPVQFMSMLVAKAATTGMRLMSHHPRHYEKDTDVPDSERRLVWTLAYKLMDIDNLLHSSKQMVRFRWHTDTYFQWQALIYMLTELKRQPLNEQVDRGWQLIHEVFEHHSDFVRDTKQPIHFAVGTLCLKAWRARAETWSERSFSMPLRTPKYIEQLAQDREQSNKARKKSVQPSSNHFDNGFDFQQDGTQAPWNPAGRFPDSDLSMAAPNFDADIASVVPQTQQMQLNNTLQQPAMPVDQQFGFGVPPVTYSQWPAAPPSGDAVMPQQEFDFNQLDMPLILEPMDWSQWDVLLNAAKTGA